MAPKLVLGLENDVVEGAGVGVKENPEDVDGVAMNENGDDEEGTGALKPK